MTDVVLSEGDFLVREIRGASNQVQGYSVCHRHAGGQREVYFTHNPGRAVLMFRRLIVECDSWRIPDDLFDADSWEGWTHGGSRNV